MSSKVGVLVVVGASEELGEEDGSKKARGMRLWKRKLVVRGNMN